ncbi:hypothetical protein K3727_15390 [Rhodobacteraceae bacterium M382]|nr:hypothetical protein K3727_15390 [Rhodobacteraceae bacterium M382]
MTALKQYERLEASGLWRPGPDDQRREVIVSIGNATLTITDLNDRPLTHWSLAAVDRQNPGLFPAIYNPDGDPGETLEMEEAETAMIEAVETLRSAIDRARPRPGRLRWASVLATIALVAAVLFLWLPGALLKHTVAVVPDIQRIAIGRALLGRIERVTGPICTSQSSDAILTRLSDRTGVRQLAVMSSGIATSLNLPGGIILLNRSLIEDHEDPAVAAGAILVERARAGQLDPLAELLTYGGPVTTFRLLTTGKLPRQTLDHFAESLLSAPRPVVPDDVLLATFAQSAIASTPYAYATDITGETVLGLIEADPMAGRKLEPVLSDRDWVQLQSICDN